MPRNYRLPKNKDMHGEANAFTMSIVGRRKLDGAFIKLKLPLIAVWTHLRTDIEELWSDGSLKSAVAYFSGKLRTMQQNITAEIVIPLPVRNGVVLDPAIFRYADKTEVFTKEAVSDIFMHTQFPRPVLDRAYIFAPPPPPGAFTPIQPRDLDVFNPTRK